MEGFQHLSNSTYKSLGLKLHCGSNEQHPAAGPTPASWKMLLPWPASTDILPSSPETFPPTLSKVGFLHSTQLFHMTRTHAQALVEMLMEYKNQENWTSHKLKCAKSSCWSTASLFDFKASVSHLGCKDVSIKSFKVRFLMLTCLLICSKSFNWERNLNLGGKMGEAYNQPVHFKVKQLKRLCPVFLILTAAVYFRQIGKHANPN